MTIEELRARLSEAIRNHDIDNEETHIRCDALLIEFIGDAFVKELYEKSEFWYA